MAISDDDLDACFSEDDFAVEATFAVSGPDVTVSGYFTEATDAVEMYGQMIEANKPSFVCKTDEIESVTRGTSVTIDEVTYTVEKISKTGVGTSVCYLKT
jgi:hypothetical protein